MASITAGTPTNVIDAPSYGNDRGPLPFPQEEPDANEDESIPKAFLNYVFLPADFDVTKAQFAAIQVSTAAKESGNFGEHEKLELNFEATEAGYLFVYFSNDEEEVHEKVFFDDFSEIAQAKLSAVLKSQLR